MDAARLQGLIAYCRAALAAAIILRGGGQSAAHPAASLPLANLLATCLDAGRGRAFSQALDTCEEALSYTVNPAILADWLATRVFIWLEEARRRERGTPRS